MTVMPVKLYTNLFVKKTNAIAVHHIGKQLVFYRASDTIKEKTQNPHPKTIVTVDFT